MFRHKSFIMKVKTVFPDWLIGAIATLFFLFMMFTGIFDFTHAIEMKTFDFRAKLAAPEQRNPDIEIVGISDDDLLELGRFPWPRDILAQGIHHLSLAGARVIALNILFPEPEESAGVKTIKSLKESYESLGLAEQEPGLSFYKQLSEAAYDLDKDAKLSSAMKEAGNVLLPITFDTMSSGRDMAVPEFIPKNTFKKIEGAQDERAQSSLIWLSEVNPLLPAFAEAAAGIGHLNFFPDNDGSIRNQIHGLGYLKDMVFPSFTIAIVKAFYGLSDDDIAIILGKGLRLRLSPSSLVEVPVMDPEMRTLIYWNAGPGVAFHQTPFSKVYKNQIQTSLFRDKIVIIGPTAPGIGDHFVTPVSHQLPGVEVIANAVANILQQRFFSRPPWILLIEVGMLVLFGFFLALALPALRTGMGAITTLGLLLACGTAGTVLFLFYDLWLKITPPMLLLTVGYILVTSKKFLMTEKTKEEIERDSVETNKMPGLSFQQQGMFDLALEKSRKLPIEDEGVKDLRYKFGSNSTLGGYEVLGELGRGAMGVVYKGEDPKIHRSAAIKTIRLSEFEDDVVEEVKERFFREAESAGLLTHPNIVTIYDCGEEGNLAYIAMEYLEGEDLESLTRTSRLLPLRETLSVVAHVAQALGYAHNEGVVHRDIKPANIMRLKETGHIKVTDFGIARITASSRTKTGVIMGTPSYMSPEQVSAKKVDGRSDIFSLGIVLFELLTGEKPFKADDMATLMYQIAKEPHVPSRTINSKIPPVVERIMNKALEKDPKKRYQDAGHMADHLRQVIAKIDELEERRGSRLKRYAGA